MSETCFPNQNTYNRVILTRQLNQLNSLEIHHASDIFRTIKKSHQTKDLWRYFTHLKRRLRIRGSFHARTRVSAKTTNQHTHDRKKRRIWFRQSFEFGFIETRCYVGFHEWRPNSENATLYKTKSKSIIYDLSDSIFCQNYRSKTHTNTKSEGKYPPKKNPLSFNFQQAVFFCSSAIEANDRSGKPWLLVLRSKTPQYP